MRQNDLAARSRRQTIRCAVYTRKSTEEGLEQDFNSLHAQRDACEAFIRSQRHEGWICLPQPYDDGGISGGTMERPALQQLFADIRARRVDIVVLYKIDRLTRSLADFAKMVEVFDAHGVSFVAVTQQFNTSTSMGRLTLNVLLSFAQFEREVIGERIRDKIAASKRKGLWMGGNPPLGYEVRDRKLVVNESEAGAVRQIYERYLALGSVRALQVALNDEGIRSKAWISRSGRRLGGNRLTRGALYLMLQNRIYLGQISHKGQHHPGEHVAIIEQELWDEVQTRLASNTVSPAQQPRSQSPSLLAGLLFDATGQRLSPTHAVKGGQRYRYYISRPLVTDGRSSCPEGLRLPAAEIENLVGMRLCQFLSDSAALFDAVQERRHLSSEAAGQLIARAREFAASWPQMLPHARRSLVSRTLRRVTVDESEVMLQLSPLRLAEALLEEPVAALDTIDNTLTLQMAVRLRRIGQGHRLLVNGRGGERRMDPAVAKMLARAHQLYAKLIAGQHVSIDAFATAQGMDRSYLTRLLRLVFLAPNIVAALLRGDVPDQLTATRLRRSSDLPLEWAQQRLALGLPDSP